MFKFVGFVLVLLFLVGCGVETSSSVSSSELIPTDNTSTQSQTDDTTKTDTTVDENTTDVVDTDTKVPADTNKTEIQDEVPDTAFDYVDAIEDPDACSISNYRMASDASYDGESSAENGSQGFVVDEQGLVIRSEHMSQDNASTWVMLFYKSFPSAENLNNQGVTSYKMDGVFYISYDIAWSDESISGIDRRMYVQSNKDSVPDCYRLDLNSSIGSLIGVQKVYRLR